VGGESAVYRVSVIADNFPITAEDIRKKTLVNFVLSKVHQFMMSGWPEECRDETLQIYHNRKRELSYEQDCVFWGTRVIIPPIFIAGAATLTTMALYPREKSTFSFDIQLSHSMSVCILICDVRNSTLELHNAALKFQNTTLISHNAASFVHTWFFLHLFESESVI